MIAWDMNQQAGFSEEVHELGAQLSIVLGCPIHYPAYNKHLFECVCGVIFPLYLVSGGNWEILRKKHKEEKELAKEGVYV